jgi:hypothetical protein
MFTLYVNYSIINYKHKTKEVDMTTFQKDLIQELNAMKEIGMNVPAKAFKLVEDTKQMESYENMGVTECADLLVQLTSIK